MRRLFAAFVIALALAATGARANDDVDAGAAAAKRQDWQTAIERYSEAIDSGALTHEELAQALLERSAGYLVFGRLDDAIADCSRALKAFPKSGACLVNRAIALTRQGNYDRAIGDFDAAIASASLSDIGFERAYVHRGHAEFRKGAYSEAIRDYTCAIEIDGTFGIAYYMRGYASYFNQHDYDRAASDIERVIALQPRWATGYVVHGYLMQLMGKTRRARTDFDTAIKLEPGNAMAHLRRGHLLLDIGDSAGGKAEWQTAFTLNPAMHAAVYNAALVWELASLPAPR